MKICRFDDSRIGIVVDETIHDVTDWIAGFIDDQEDGWGDPLVRALPAILAASIPPFERPGLPVSAVRLLSPVRRPSKIIAAPNNYRAHQAEMQGDLSAGHAHPVADLEKAGLFLKATSSLVGAGEGIAQRFLDRRTDYEVELVAVIGRTIVDPEETELLAAVAGYAVGLDITVRGPEERSLRKSIDTYTVLGPWLATVDEVGAPDEIELSLKVDGALKQHTSTSDMITSVARLICYASNFYTLHPGDLIYTGTCSGVGPIHPGNMLIAAATRIGTMQVAVSAYPQSLR
jgi:2-keto-4-pentenoate hydratase/2-oxohepta-3-ene-1,7-dioic acid hydratase in catechol pathway